MSTIIERRGHSSLTVNSELETEHREILVAENSQPGMYGASGYFKNPIDSVERRFFSSLDAMKSKLAKVEPKRVEPKRVEPKRVEPKSDDSSKDEYIMYGILVASVAFAVIFKG